MKFKVDTIIVEDCGCVAIKDNKFKSWLELYCLTEHKDQRRVQDTLWELKITKAWWLEPKSE